MYSYNRVHIIGYQTQPVELRQTPSGASVTDLNFVVPYSFTSENGETIQGKGFHTVTLWGPMADIAGQFIKPGSQVFISGRLQTDSWEDQQSGDKRSKTKIVAMDIIMLDPRDGQLPAPQNAPALSTCTNRVDIVGNASRDPELRTTGTGQKVLTLGVATNDRWKDKSSGEDRERSEFHNVVVWGALAEQVESSIKKGNRVYVTGRVQTRSWEAKDGSKRYTTEVVADSVLLLGIANAAALESVSADAAPQTAKAPQAQEAAPAAEKEPAPVGASVPEVTYSSEIKVEDLPF
jgi:single-strand DNA-binding protein